MLLSAMYGPYLMQTRWMYHLPEVALLAPDARVVRDDPAKDGGAM